jgi:muramoyltetrapeptide carboxypeptidase
MRIAVVAPSCTLKREAADGVQAIVAQRGDSELVIHPQCFLSDGHFAGPDEARLAALREAMADETVGAIWFARGGYGSTDRRGALQGIPDAARSKLYLGYSDAGFLQAGFHKAGLDVAWGRCRRTCCDQVAMRPSIGRSTGSLRARAHRWNPIFNRQHGVQPDGPRDITGTVLEPDFSGVDLLVEDVSEHHYRIDRTMFHVAASPNVRRVARLRLGRVGNIPENDPDFGRDECDIVEEWCVRSGIPFGGRADIGHDAANRVVPFLRKNG